MPSNRMITKIKICKKKVNISFSNGDKLAISHNVYPKFYLYVGKVISDKELKEIKEAENGSTLLTYAYSLVSKKFYSEWALREKLYAKEADKKNVDYIIKTLKANNLINDSMLANDLKNYYDEKGYGKNKIIHNLEDKGIFKTEIEKLNFPYKNEIKKAKSHIERLEKKYEKYSYQAKKNKIISALVNLGFDVETAIEASGDMKKIDNKNENKKLKEDMKKIHARLKKKYEGYELKQKLVQALMGKGYRYKDISKEIEIYEID